MMALNLNLPTILSNTIVPGPVLVSLLLVVLHQLGDHHDHPHLPQERTKLKLNELSLESVLSVWFNLGRYG